MIIDITAGNEHCLALTETGDSVFAWGQGKYGALGTSKSQNFSTPTEIDKPDGLLVASIAAGSRHSAFITVEQDLYMFGLGASG